MKNIIKSKVTTLSRSRWGDYIGSKVVRITIEIKVDAVVVGNKKMAFFKFSHPLTVADVSHEMRKVGYRNAKPNELQVTPRGYSDSVLVFLDPFHLIGSERRIRQIRNIADKFDFGFGHAIFDWVCDYDVFFVGIEMEEAESLV